MVREEWICLNGEWEFAFDDDDRGLEERWFEDGHRLDRRIIVPFAYQADLSGVGDKGVHEIVWYARDLETPPGFPDRDFVLHFGAVDYRSTVWVNGQEVAHNRGGHVPFAIDICPYLREGTNRIVLRVEDRQDAHQPRGKQSIDGIPRTTDYYCTTGIWQTVWLEPLSPIRFDHLRIVPHLEWQGGDDALEIDVTLHAPAAGWRVEIEVLNGEEVVAHAQDDSGCPACRQFLTIKDARRWSPEDPFLYDLRLKLYEGETLLDEIRSYAGLRVIGIRNGQILLNGEPIYLKMVLDQGYWPDGNMTAPSDEALRHDIELTKAMGFNGSRKHQKVEEPRWLYWCDRLGLLVWGEMANSREWCVEAEEMFIAEWQRVLRRDANHPCIVTWVPLNESWGLPGLEEEHAGQYAFLERVVQLTRRSDSTRPVIDNDGWEHTDITDIAAIHDYTPTGDKIRARYAETVAGGPLPAKTWYEKHERSHFLRGACHRGQPVVLSEVGGFLMVPAGLPKERLDWLYSVYGTINSEQELLDRYRDLMQGLADLKFLSGFCYTQLTDIEQEINGLLTYDRKPKVPVEEIARIHRELFH